MVYEYLLTGKENALTRDYLCSIIGVNRRELTKAIEAERRAGQPICASNNSSAPGYYIAADKEEMARFCRSLRHRAGEIFKTRRACMACINNLPDAEPEVQA